VWRAGQAPVARGASAPGADRLGAARPRAARRALHDGVQVRRQQRQHLCIRVAAGHLQPRPGMSACGGQAPAGLPPQAPSAPPAPHSAPRTSSGHCSAAGSARAAAGAARSGLASAAACCCAACSALEHSVVRARTLAVKWHSAAVKEGRSRGACSQSTDMVLKPCPPRRVSLLKRLFSWAQSKHWLIALQPYPTIRSRCRQLASRGSARAALRRTRAQRGAVMRRIPNDDAERLRTVHNEKYLLMGVRALGAASNALLGRAHCARPACGARQALPSAVDRPVQVDAGALASQVAERHAREAGVAQRDRRASGPPKTYSLGDAHLARVSLGLLMFDGKKASLGSSSVTCLKAGPGEPLRHRAVPRGVTL